MNRRTFLTTLATAPIPAEQVVTIHKTRAVGSTLAFRHHFPPSFDIDRLFRTIVRDPNTKNLRANAKNSRARSRGEEV